MKKTNYKGIINTSLYVIFFGILFWFIESLIHTFIFHDQTLYIQLFHPSAHETWMRAIVIFFLVPFIIYLIFFINKQKITEKELQRERDRVKHYLNIMDAIMLVVESNQNVSLINKKGIEILGYNENEIIGKNWFDNFLPNEIKEEKRNIFNRTINGEIRLIEYFENKIITKTGNERIIAWHNTILKDDNNKFRAILRYGEDITERKLIEEKLKRNYETESVINVLLRLSLENIPIEQLLNTTINLIYSISWLSFKSEGCIFLVEDEPNILIMKAHYGLDEERIKLCAKVPFGQCTCGKTALRGEIQSQSNCQQNHHNSVTPHGHYCIPIISSGNVLGVINIYLDQGYQGDEKDVRFLTAIANTLAGVISRKKAEKTLFYRIEFEKLISTISTKFINLGLNEIDEEINNSLSIIGNYLHINGAYLYLFTNKTTKAQNTHRWSKEGSQEIKDEYRVIEAERFPNIFDKLKRFEHCYICGTKNYSPETQELKNEFNFEDNNFIIIVPLISNKILMGFLALFSKTLNKILEEHDISMIRMLAEVFVNALERKRLETQFLQSQKMETIGRLAGGIAHDLNNLMTPILGYSHLVMKSISEKDSSQNDLKEIYSAAERAKNLTRQLLAFSRRQTLEPQIININFIISNMENMLKRIIGETIELKTNLSENIGNVKVDISQFEQVITNLIVNSKDAMPNGGKITIETSNITYEQYSDEFDLQPDSYVVLSVSDTGIGMGKEVKSHIFEPFFTTKKKGEGTGLGLATCYGIIKQSGGNICVQSEINKGSSFKILLPNIQDEAIQPINESKMNVIDTRTETVLLVEDEDAVRSLTLKVLKENGYKVYAASSGEEAMQIIQNGDCGEIHLLLTDAIMPNMNGKVLSNKIKKIKPKIKILFISGYTDNTILDVPSNPNISFLAKPFTPNELLHKIDLLLRS